MARTGATYDEALAQAQELGYAEADPTEDVNGKRRRGEDGDPRPAGLRHARSTSTRSRYEGIEHITPDDLEYAREFGLSLKLIGTAERVDGGLSVRVHPAFLYGDHPLASVVGPVQRRHGRVRRDHRDHDVGPGRRRAADGERRARRRRQRDDPARAGAPSRS